MARRGLAECSMLTWVDSTHHKFNRDIFLWAAGLKVGLQHTSVAVYSLHTMQYPVKRSMQYCRYICSMYGRSPHFNRDFMRTRIMVVWCYKGWYTVVCNMYGCSLLSTFQGRFYELAEWDGAGQLSNICSCYSWKLDWDRDTVAVWGKGLLMDVVGGNKYKYEYEYKYRTTQQYLKLLQLKTGLR